MGFTHEVTLAEMVDLGRRYGLKVVEDLGSGCLVDLSRYGLEREPTVQETLKAGADLVLFPATSSWRAPGGPHPGKPRSSGNLAKKPMTRALRPDKMTLTPWRPHCASTWRSLGLGGDPYPQDVDPAGGGVGPPGPRPGPAGAAPFRGQP